MNDTFLILYYFKSSSFPHYHVINDSEYNAIKIANRYFGINSVRTVILYDENMNVIYSRGDV